MLLKARWSWTRIVFMYRKLTERKQTCINLSYYIWIWSGKVLGNRIFRTQNVCWVTNKLLCFKLTIQSSGVKKGRTFHVKINCEVLISYKLKLNREIILTYSFTDLLFIGVVYYVHLQTFFIILSFSYLYEKLTWRNLF